MNGGSGKFMRQYIYFKPLPLLKLFGEPSVCSTNIPRMKVLSRSR